MLLLICKSGTADVSLYSTHSIVLVEKALCVCSAYTFLFLYVGLIYAILFGTFFDRKESTAKKLSALELHSHINCNVRLQAGKLATLRQSQLCCCLTNIDGSLR